MKKRIALITGATSGIGEACARRFAMGGYNVIITGRNSKRLDEIKKELETEGTAVLTLCFDVSDRAQTAKAVESLSEEWKAIDVLINNAGSPAGCNPNTRATSKTGTRWLTPTSKDCST